jgi:hypothetical protein
MLSENIAKRAAQKEEILFFGSSIALKRDPPL